MWLKAWHLIAMTTWFAALFYLPRLYVYHAMSDDKISIDRFKIMERKLYRGIMTPSMIVTLALGGWMLYDYAWQAFGSMIWLQIKLVLIGILVAYHFWCGKIRQDLLEDKDEHSHVWFRWFNEFPVILLVAIVLLAVLKPVSF